MNRELDEITDKVLPTVREKNAMIHTLFGNAYCFLDFIMENVDCRKITVELAYQMGNFINNLSAIKECQIKDIHLENLKDISLMDIKEKLILVTKTLNEICKKEGLIE